MQPQHHHQALHFPGHCHALPAHQRHPRGLTTPIVWAASRRTALT
jgi:hypothetical protein